MANFTAADDRCAYDLAPVRIFDPYNGAFQNVRMAAEYVFNLKRRDFVSTGLDDVDRVPSQDAINSVLAQGDVAGSEPTVVGKRRTGGLFRLSYRGRNWLWY